MDRKINRNDILNFFKVFNQQGVKYVLLHNIDNELPDNLTIKKDIDILVKDTDKGKFKHFMKSDGWKKIKHPYDYGDNFVFLYNMDKLEMYKKNNMHIDICYQLNCRSINNGEWMPLDQKINESVWENRIKNTQYPWYQLDVENQIVHLIVRCIFYKRQFNNKYVKEISRNFDRADKELLVKKFNLIFFRFTMQLMILIQECRYEEIINSYITFSDY